MHAADAFPKIGLAPGASPAPLAYALIFAGAAAAFCLSRMIAVPAGSGAVFLAAAGGATCGWSWLLTRALFRPAAPAGAPWRHAPLAVVLAMVAAQAILRASGDSPATRMIANAETLISSTLLLLAAIEPLRGLTPTTAPAERQFRLVYAGGYAGLVAVAVVAANGAPHAGAIKTVCAGLALAGMAGAVWRRQRHPLSADAALSKIRAAPSESERDLAQRLLAQLRQDGAFAEADLRVADIARRLGAPEYKVSQCVTGALGFRNFNHLINHFRIDDAKRRLADRALDRLPVLTIALDCGFGSIGPFNRAFKAETGMTPMEFRRAHRAAD